VIPQRRQSSAFQIESRHYRMQSRAGCGGANVEAFRWLVPCPSHWHNATAAIISTDALNGTVAEDRWYDSRW
jgi:hypothetical protein